MRPEPNKTLHIRHRSYGRLSPLFLPMLFVMSDRQVSTDTVLLMAASISAVLTARFDSSEFEGVPADEGI